VLAIFGPAWNYILIRGLYSRKANQSPFAQHRSPEKTLILIVSICFAIEFAQYLGIYDAHFDPFDFLAYISLLLPCYVVDKLLLQPTAKTPRLKSAVGLQDNEQT